MGLLQIKTKQICLVQQVNGPSGSDSRTSNLRCWNKVERINWHNGQGFKMNILRDSSQKLAY